MRAIAFGVSVASCLLASAASADMSICDGIAGNIVQNCGFEGGEVKGVPNDWEVSGGQGETLVQDPNSGAWAIDLSAAVKSTGHQTAGLESNSFLLASGDTSLVSFYVKAISMSEAGSSFTVALLGGLGSALGSWSVTSDSGYTGNYTKVSFDVVGDGGPDSISLEALQSGHGNLEWRADDFVVTPQAVPEPASLMLLGSGLLASGAFGRRRRRKTQAPK